MANGRNAGLAELKEAVEKAPAERRDEAQDELRFAEAAGIHFRSVANQVRFVTARNSLQAASEKAGSGMRKERVEEMKRVAREEMKRVAHEEIDLARRLFSLCREDSQIGFEAANQYFYVSNDLMEKVVNCRFILDSEIMP